MSIKGHGGHMGTIEGQLIAGRRRRRRHSEEFKAAVVAQCRRSGVSLASVALANGLNANLLRRWVVERERGGATSKGEVREFVPVRIEDKGAEGQEIRIEFRRGTTAVTVTWPLSAAEECGRWLREWLR